VRAIKIRPSGQDKGTTGRTGYVEKRAPRRGRGNGDIDKGLAQTTGCRQATPEHQKKGRKSGGRAYHGGKKSCSKSTLHDNGDEHRAEKNMRPQGQPKKRRMPQGGACDLTPGSRRHLGTYTGGRSTSSAKSKRRGQKKRGGGTLEKVRPRGHKVKQKDSRVDRSAHRRKNKKNKRVGNRGFRGCLPKKKRDAEGSYKKENRSLYVGGEIFSK